MDFQRLDDTKFGKLVNQLMRRADAMFGQVITVIPQPATKIWALT
jgi:hypothetical protein